MMFTRHPQDDLLLVDYAYLFEEGDPDRADRALALADELAVRHGLATTEAILQIDDEHYRRDRSELMK